VRRHHRSFHEAGFNLPSRGRDHPAARPGALRRGMGGLGFAFRYRPLPHPGARSGHSICSRALISRLLAQRGRAALNAIGFFNPGTSSQIYGLGGNRLQRSQRDGSRRARRPGLRAPRQLIRNFWPSWVWAAEVRVTHSVALGGRPGRFIRTPHRQTLAQPTEFEDPNTHRVPNSSGGGLFAWGDVLLVSAASISFDRRAADGEARGAARA